MNRSFLFGLLLLVTLVSCKPATMFRIRTGDIIKDYDLLHVRDSTLLVQDWTAHGDGMWRTVQHIPFHSITSLWHVESNRKSNISWGAGLGLGITLGLTYLIPWQGYGGLAVLLLASPIVASIGAIIGNSIPAADLELQPNDPETLPFLEDHKWYRDVEDMPPILREKASR